MTFYIQCTTCERVVVRVEEVQRNPGVTENVAELLPAGCPDKTLKGCPHIGRGEFLRAVHLGPGGPA